MAASYFLPIKLSLPYFSISYFPNRSNCFFDAQTILLVKVDMLPRYQSPVNFRSRKVEETLSTNRITVTIVIFQALNLYSYLKQTACLLKVMV
jgi:hypothetical protein